MGIFRVLLVVNAVIRAMLAVLLVVEDVPRSATRVLLVCHLMVGSFCEMFFLGFMHSAGNVMPLRVPAVPINNALHLLI